MISFEKRKNLLPCFDRLISYFLDLKIQIIFRVCNLNMTSQNILTFQNTRIKALRTFEVFLHFKKYFDGNCFHNVNFFNRCFRSQEASLIFCQSWVSHVRILIFICAAAVLVKSEESLELFLKSLILIFITSHVFVLQFYLKHFEAFICSFYDRYLIKIF